MKIEAEEGIEQALRRLDEMYKCRITPKKD
jgi:hypothetical protein